MRTDPVERLGRRARAEGVPLVDYLGSLPAWDRDLARLARELSGRAFRAERPWWRGRWADLTLRRLAGEVPDEVAFAGFDQRMRDLAELATGTAGAR